MRFTLDQAAVSLVQMEAEDATSAKRLRDRIRRLSRSRVLSARASAEVEHAADALAVVARGDADAGAALAAAGRHIEYAMRATEDGVAEMASAPARLDPQGVDPLMLASLAALELEETGARPAGGTEAQAMIAHVPAPPQWSADADPELLESFVAESIEYLESAEAALLVLEAEPTSAEAVNTVFRCFHTIKGTSAFLGLARVSELAHRAESLMSRVRDREIRLEGRYAELALRSVDVLGELVRAVTAALEGRMLAEPASWAPLLAALSNPEEASERAPAQRGVEAGQRNVETGDTTHSQGAEAWMRVRTDRLDRLVDTIGELVIAQSMIAQDVTVARTHDEALARRVAHAGKIVRELQDLSIAMRMVPLKGVMQKLARVVRDAAVKSGKQVDLVVVGEETELDRNTVDVIGDPLIHMIRNAVDHGIEAPAERAAARKPSAGTIRVTAGHAGGSIVLTLSDDGRGLDRTRIVEKAVLRGLIESERGLTDRDVFELIFAPGFSTAETVTDLSGRGVGMDVVRRSVESLRGRIDIESEAGKGSSFSIRLPLTLAITDGMLVRIGTERYIVPTLNIERTFRPERAMLSTVAGRGEMVLLRGAVLPIARLDRVLGIHGGEPDPTRALLMVVGCGERRCALLVDELLGQQQLVAKSLGAGLGRVRGVSGGAILGDGRVGLILDIAGIIALTRQSRPELAA